MFSTKSKPSNLWKLLAFTSMTIAPIKMFLKYNYKCVSAVIIVLPVPVYVGYNKWLKLIKLKLPTEKGVIKV